jgi:very-short-patch-repair endonuclease
MRPKHATDAAIAAIASAQHGVVARRQLLTLGLTHEAVARRRGTRLHVVHRGVYAVGHTVLTREGRWMAAVLAAGRDAVLSHATAAAAWELRPPGAGAIHVNVPGTPGRKRRQGIRIHRSTTLTPDDTTAHRGIPITTPTRTIIDLASTLTGRRLEQALDRADYHRLVDFAELTARPIPRSLQAQLTRYTATNPTRSELEERFLALWRDQKLPRPETNIVIEGVECDFVWRAQRLIVEVDGYRYHRSPSTFEHDRERDIKLTLAGWTVLRFTWAQITGRPAWVAMAIGARLGGRPAPRGLRSAGSAASSPGSGGR